MGIYVNPKELDSQEFTTSEGREIAKAHWFNTNGIMTEVPTDEEFLDLTDECRVICVVFNSGFTACAVIPKEDVKELHRFRDAPNDSRPKVWFVMMRKIVEANVAADYVGKF